MQLTASAAGEERTETPDAEAAIAEEAALALMTLGYAGPTARQAVRKALDDDPGRELTVQQLINLALKQR